MSYDVSSRNSLGCCAAHANSGLGHGSLNPYVGPGLLAPFFLSDQVALHSQSLLLEKFVLPSSLCLNIVWVCDSCRIPWGWMVGEE